MADAKSTMNSAESGVKTTGKNMGHPTGAKSSKSGLVTLLLTIFLGDLGIHRFYVGKGKTGLIQLLLCGSFVGGIIDIVRVVTDKFTDVDGKIISNK